MSNRIKSLLAKIKAYKSPLFYGVVIAALTISLLVILSSYRQHDENILKAAGRGQYVVYDLETQEKIDPALITKSHKTAHAPAPAAVPGMAQKPAQVSFIIANIGANSADAEKAIATPKEFLLSFSPYAENSLQLSKTAKEAGHNILVDLPVQMKDINDKPGNMALLVENNAFKNQRNFEAALSKIYSPSGVIIPAGDLFTHSDNFTPILQEIAKRKFFLVYGGEGEEIDAKAKDNDIELLKVDIVIDAAGDIEKQLTEIENIGHKTGFAVVIAKDLTAESIDKIVKWSTTAAARDVHLTKPAQ